MKTILVFAAALMVFGFSQCRKDPGDKPKPTCVCPEVYAPVCGSNGKTYSNSCFAECDGIKQYKPGPCEPRKVNH